MKKYPIKKVVWRDSSMYIQQEPIDTEWDVKLLTSIGFVIQEDKKQITLAGDLLDEDCRRVIVIPKENIVK